MELDHTEAIKQGVMAGLGVAFVSLYAVQGEIAAGRLRALRLRGVRIQRHFHIIHHEARRVTASARAFMQLFEETARERRRGLGHSKRRDHPPVHQSLQES
jgi:DNA-binding transcriptional LysR family regulator